MMSFDDDGTWNNVQPAASMGTTAISIAAVEAALVPTGAETQMRAIYNGELLDFGVLRFQVK